MTSFECPWCGDYFKNEDPRYINGDMYCAKCAEFQEIGTALFTSFTCAKCGKYNEKDIPYRESGKLYCDYCWYHHEREKARQYSSYTCFICDYVYQEEPCYITPTGKLVCLDCGWDDGRIDRCDGCGRDMLRRETHSKLGNLFCQDCWKHYISIKNRK